MRDWTWETLRQDSDNRACRVDESCSRAVQELCLAYRALRQGVSFEAHLFVERSYMVLVGLWSGKHVRCSRLNTKLKQPVDLGTCLDILLENVSLGRLITNTHISLLVYCV